MSTAYSYQRFSSPEQGKGDSIRRQTAARDAWLAAHPDVKLDTSIRMTDAGRSAFKRTNAETYALAEFVEHVKGGRVKPGSYLLVENLDRLSREHAGEAVEMFLSIVNKGITIVQLAPSVLEFRKPVDTMSLMFAIVELSRGHSESAVKSSRGASVWNKKQGDAAKTIVTKRLPSWIRCVDGRLELDPEKAAVVRRIYKLALDGDGTIAIAQRLNAEAVPVLGRAFMKNRPVQWAPATIYFLLTTRAVLGEYVPFKAAAKVRDDRTALAPVPGYFPELIDHTTFQRVQAALKLRAVVGRGRRGKAINMFAGLLKDAATGGSAGYRTWAGVRVVAPLDLVLGRVSFPGEAFDEQILSQLAEVKVSDVEGTGVGTDAAQRVEALSTELKGVEALEAVWAKKMTDPNNVGIADLITTTLNAARTRKTAIAVDLESAQRDAASPTAEAVGAMKTLIDLLRDDPTDEMRRKVRAAVRRVVKAVHLVTFAITPRRKVAVVLVEFHAGSTFRLYFLKADTGRNREPGAVSGASRTWEHLNCDIRDAAGREKLEAFVRREFAV